MKRQGYIPPKIEAQTPKLVKEYPDMVASQIIKASQSLEKHGVGWKMLKMDDGSEAVGLLFPLDKWLLTQEEGGTRLSLK